MGSRYQQALDYIKTVGFGVTHPHDPSLEEGNRACGALKPYGISDLDCEEFYHKPYPAFACHIPGCESVFDTVLAYESHYKSCHAFTCQECRKNLPNLHLLDLHLSETHDSFFLAQAETKPMFRCFSQECKERFKHPKERRDHCITVHKYPSNFRYDATRRKKCVRKKQREKLPEEEPKETVEVDDSDIVIDPEIRPTNKSQKCRNLTFGYSRARRKPVFTNFSKDLMKCLPDV